MTTLNEDRIKTLEEKQRREAEKKRIADEKRRKAELRLRKTENELSRLKRKREDRQKYELGGLAKIAFPGEVDKGTILGLSLWAAEILSKPFEQRNEWEKTNSARWKQRGDAELSKRAAEQKANREAPPPILVTTPAPAES